MGKGVLKATSLAATFYKIYDSVENHDSTYHNGSKGAAPWSKVETIAPPTKFPHGRPATNYGDDHPVARGNGSPPDNHNAVVENIGLNYIPVVNS